ncbi:serine hydrolase [Sphingomonas cavernae]|uniref:Serine hydrolase n=1 Tax=Sphingomonas cavernae TaxID=2320861 RepID=A0A418WKV3_9SPHN|nr:serine hydrolase [Sphingomonas cavernae]RJF90638.1 serine hydrolase [Sphingomonas cavernae]
MKKLILAFALASTPLAAAPPPNFDARVEQVRTSAGVPGMAIAIVEDGKTVLAKGYGEKKLGSRDAVTPDTIFPTGSTGKAVTVAALATLVDQGKIAWDDKVIDHLPWFQMWDSWVTREMTIRDLLVHRSGLGLGAGDLLFVPRSNLSRKEAVERLRYIKPATSFRSGYAYDNILYMVAGQLIEEVTGQTWEDYVAQHVFKPAGMLASTSDDVKRFAAADRAMPHARMNGGLRGAGDQEPLNERDELARNAAPAGGLAVSASDMAKWLALQLAHGKLPDGGQLYSEKQAAEMWKPVVLQPNAPRPEALKLTQSMFDTYALGWTVQDYRGAKIVWHGGAVFGFLTAVVLLPQKNVGFSIEINSEDGHVIRGLMYELLDHYLGFPSEDWPAKYAEVRKQSVAKGLALFKATAARPAGVGPSLSLDRYVGTFADPWYGNISVARDKAGLTVDFKSTPRMGGRLKHFQYDTFITRFDDKTIEPAYVTFGLNADGKVERVTMKAVSPLADFSYDYHDLLFTPVAPSAK